MNRHFAITTAAYIGSVAAALLAVAFMSGKAHAEGPIEVLPPFAGTLSSAQVRADLMQHRAQVSGYESEWERQRNSAVQAASSTTRAQVRADYIAARDEVHAMTSEDGGSSFLANGVRRLPQTTVAGSGMR